MQLSFIKRTSNAYHSCKKRAKKVGEFLDYTVDGLRDLIAAALQQPCPYCGTTLTVKNFAPDHRTPLSRGGSHCLGNVIVCCRPCNEVKGILTELEFTKLVQLLREYPPAVRTDVIARLRFGGRRGR